MCQIIAGAAGQPISGWFGQVLIPGPTTAAGIVTRAIVVSIALKNPSEGGLEHHEHSEVL